MSDHSSALGARKNFHQLGHLLTLLIGVPAGDGMLDAVRHVIPQHLFLDPSQRRPHSRQLRENVDAVTVLGHHARNPAHLALYAAKALQA
ncbi:protein of unknown function [Hyphomicrobium sp. 1Nfss2.1]